MILRPPGLQPTDTLFPYTALCGFTECITGLDRGEQMIRVAAGEALSFTQEEVKRTGWAIENRVYAEDPYRGFLPSTGRLVRYIPPLEMDGVRVDDGVM